MTRPTIINKYRSRKIGKFYTISATPLTNNKCKVELTKFIDPKTGFKQVKIGTFHNSKKNQEASSVYFGIRTVKHCDKYWNLNAPKMLIKKKPVKRTTNSKIDYNWQSFTKHEVFNWQTESILPDEADSEEIKYIYEVIKNWTGSKKISIAYNLDGMFVTKNQERLYNRLKKLYAVGGKEQHITDLNIYVNCGEENDEEELYADDCDLLASIYVYSKKSKGKEIMHIYEEFDSGASIVSIYILKGK